jgi:hypothetical protein
MDAAYENMSVMSAEQADMLDELGDKWNGLQQELVVGIVPAIALVIDAFKKLKDDAVILASFFQQFGIALYNSILQTLKDIFSGKVLNPAMIAKQFMDNFSAAASEGWKEIAQVAVGVAAERADQDSSDADRRAARIARRKRKGISDYDAFDSGAGNAPQVKASQLMSDSLIRTGNFLGTNRTALESIANRQVQLLQSIDRNTRKMAEKTDTTDSLGIEA